MPLMPTTPSSRELVLQVAGGAPVRRPPGRVAHDVAGDPDPVRLVVLVVDAGVADVRRGLHDDLPVVGRVGQRLLVAGHAGGEDGLAEGLARRRRTASPRKVRPSSSTSDRLRPPRSPTQLERLPVQHRRLARAGTSRRRGRAASRPAYGVLRLRLASAAGSTVQRAAGSTSVRLAGAPGASGSRPWPASPAIRAGARGHPLGDAGPVEPAGVDHRRQHDRQRRLQADHARRGRTPTRTPCPRRRAGRGRWRRRRSCRRPAPARSACDVVVRCAAAGSP